jgi:hypothetical protein
MRFRDAFTNQLVGGEATEAFDVKQEEFSWRTPVAETDSKAILEFSFNKKDWQTIVP